MESESGQGWTQGEEEEEDRKMEGSDVSDGDDEEAELEATEALGASAMAMSDGSTLSARLQEDAEFQELLMQGKII